MSSIHLVIAVYSFFNSKNLDTYLPEDLPELLVYRDGCCTYRGAVSGHHCALSALIADVCDSSGSADDPGIFGWLLALDWARA